MCKHPLLDSFLMSLLVVLLYLTAAGLGCAIQYGSTALVIGVSILGVALLAVQALIRLTSAAAAFVSRGRASLPLYLFSLLASAVAIYFMLSAGLGLVSWLVASLVAVAALALYFYMAFYISRSPSGYG